MSDDNIDTRKTTIKTDDRKTTVQMVDMSSGPLPNLGPTGTVVNEDYSSTIYQNITTFRGYDSIGRLSSGGEADLHIVVKNNVKFVLKLYFYNINPDTLNLDTIRNISEINSDHLVRLFENGRDPQLKRYYEIMEYIEHGSLDKYIETGEAKNFDFNSILIQLTDAIDVLHKNDINHCDIKPANILIRNLNPLELVVADFGISSKMNQSVIKKTCTKKTSYYAAPEQFSGHITFKTDYWSMGIVLCELLTGQGPFHGFDDNTIYFNISTHQPIDIPTNVDPRIQLLLKGLITPDVNHRWGDDEVRRWLKGEDPEVFSEPTVQITEAPKREPFTFLNQNHDSLYELAMTMSSSAENWEAGGRYLASEYFTSILSRRDDINWDIINTLDEIKCNDSNEHVFRFIHTFNRDLPISYRGLALTAKNLLQALADNHSEDKPVIKDFIWRTLNNGWDSLINYIINNNSLKNIDTTFLAIVLLKYNKRFNFDIQNREKLTNLLIQTITSNKYFWGFLKHPSIKERTVKYQLNSEAFGRNKDLVLEITLPWQLYCSLYAKKAIRSKKDLTNIFPKGAVIPQGIARKLSDVKTFENGMDDLLSRVSEKKLLTTRDLKNDRLAYNPKNNVFNNTDRIYDELFSKYHDSKINSFFSIIKNIFPKNK
jgi:serine/threonine protein kinase